MLSVRQGQSREDRAAKEDEPPWAKLLTCVLCKKLSKFGARGYLCPKSFGVWGMSGETLQSLLQGELPTAPGEVLPHCPREEQQQTMAEGKLPQSH